MPKFDLSCRSLEQYSVDLRQFIDFRTSTLPNGMRIVEAFNSSGFRLPPAAGCARPGYLDDELQRPAADLDQPGLAPPA